MSGSPYMTKGQFTEKHKAFSAGSLRSLLERRKKNGLDKAGAVILIGRKLLINEERFLNWVQSKSEAGT